MDMNLINQAIKESLPQAVGEILTKELLELKQLRDKIEDVVLENQNLLNINHVLKKENENLRQKEIEIEHSVRILLELQDQRVKDMKDVLIAVFKSPVYRSYTHGSVPVKNPNGYFDTLHSSEHKETTVE